MMEKDAGFKVGDTVYSAGYWHINKTVVEAINDNEPEESSRRYYLAPANGFTGGYAPKIFKTLGDAIIWSRKVIDDDFDEDIREANRKRKEAHIELNEYIIRLQRLPAIAELQDDQVRPIIHSTGVFDEALKDAVAVDHHGKPYRTKEFK